MLSRVAERLYWMARYIERAENTARLVSVYSMLLLDLPRGVGIHWRQLVEIYGGNELFYSRYRSDGESNILKFIAADTGNPGSLLATLAMARENVRTTRDQIPSEAWQAINELYLFGRRRLPAPTFRKNLHRILSEIIARCQRTTGVLSGAMSHGPGYQFVRIGRNIERADMTSRIVDVGSTTLIAEGDERKILANRLWMNVLNALSAHQMYRQYVRRRIRRGDVIRYLMEDADFPRSVSHSLLQLQECLGQLPNQKKPEQAIARLRKSIMKQEFEDLAGDSLHKFIDHLQEDLAGIHQIIARTWFVTEVDEKV